MLKKIFLFILVFTASLLSATEGIRWFKTSKKEPPFFAVYQYENSHTHHKAKKVKIEPFSDDYRLPKINQLINKALNTTKRPLTLTGRVNDEIKMQTLIDEITKETSKAIKNQLANEQHSNKNSISDPITSGEQNASPSQSLFKSF